MHAGEEKVKRWIRQADDYSRAKLENRGYKPADVGKRPAYFVPTQATAAPELAESLDRSSKTFFRL